ncbi:UNVERIFIED_CONTAM: hypothetical protein Slati_3933300 [Sesamum latifolium]|uniref:Zinc knuckle CX2CX4HX4C domain-containing protein n=1 Tax=Sesamum latifolium TaxID=2727402 RepID=A0AAW2TNK4_9LAMI
MLKLNFSGGAKVRIRVSLDTRKPLTRALHIRLIGGDDEVMVMFIYERLPNFFYGCGVLGHIMRDCERHLDKVENWRMEDLPYGPWLRETIEVRFTFMVEGYGNKGSITTVGWAST